MCRFLRRTKSLPHRNKRSRIGVVAINITQQRTQLLPRRRIQAPMLLQAILRPSLQLIKVPPSLRHANHRDIKGATLDHRLQRRKNLLIRKIASRTEEHQRIGMKLTHAFSPSTCNLLTNRLLEMTAKLITHRRQQFIREVSLTARTEPLIKRRSQHRSWNAFIDPGLDRPASFTRIRDSASILRHLRIANQRSRSQIQQPRSNHAPTPPDLSHIRQIEVVLIMFRITQRRSLSVDLSHMLADIGSFQHTKPLCVSRHHPVLNPVMHHLDEVSAAIPATVQIALLCGPTNLLAPRSTRDISNPRSDSLEDGIKILHRRIRPTNHHAVTPLQPPHPSAGPHINIMNSFFSKLLRAANIVDVIRISAIDQDVAGFKMWSDLLNRLLHNSGRNHQPDRARFPHLTHHILQRRGAGDSLLLCHVRNHLRRHIEHDALVTMRYQPPNHVRPHPTQAYHSKLHTRSLSIVRWFIDIENFGIFLVAQRLPLLVFSISPNQIRRRSIVSQHRLCRTLQLANDPLCQHLAKLDTPLVERVDAPNRTLRKHCMFVQRNQLAQHLRRELIRQNRIRWTITLEHPMRNQPVRRALRLHLLRRLAKRQRLSLRKDIRHQHVVVSPQRIERLVEPDEIARNQPRPLMDQLIERVLPIRPRLTPVDRPRLSGDTHSLPRDMLAVALHRQLLQVRRKALQILFIRQHSHRLRIEEVGIPDRQQPHQHRQITREGSGAEVFIHLVKPIQHRAKVIWSDRHHGRQTDRRIHRVTSTDPVPELKHVRRIDAKLRYLFSISRDCHEVLCNSLLIAPQSGQRPVACRMRIRHRLQRRKGLRRNQKKRLFSIQIPHRLRKVSSINVRDKAKGNIALAVEFQRLIRHHRSKIRATNPNVDDVTNPLARVPLPRTAANTIGERGHLVQYSMHRWNNILTVNNDRLALRRSQRNVKHSTVLRDIDLFSTEHCVDTRPQPRIFRQLNQKLQRLIRDAVLRVVEKDPTCLNCESLAARRIFRKHLLQLLSLNLLGMRFQGLPPRALTERYQLRHLLTPCVSLSSRTRLLFLRLQLVPSGYKKRKAVSLHVFSQSSAC